MTATHAAEQVFVDLVADGWDRDDVSTAIDSLIEAGLDADQPDDGHVLTDDEIDVVRDQLTGYVGLVGVAEVARMAGLTESSVRTYVRRGTIITPLPVAGSDALVWRRADVERWMADRRGPGRPRAGQ